MISSHTHNVSHEQLCIFISGPEKGRVNEKPMKVYYMHNLSTLSADTTSQLDILGHNGDTLGVDSAQVGVLK